MSTDLLIFSLLSFYPSKYRNTLLISCSYMQMRKSPEQSCLWGLWIAFRICYCYEREEQRQTRVKARLCHGTFYQLIMNVLFDNWFYRLPKLSKLLFLSFRKRLSLKCLHSAALKSGSGWALDLYSRLEHSEEEILVDFLKPSSQTSFDNMTKFLFYI